MARVTVEDCVLKVPNRFELVMLAAQRARDVSAGAVLTVDRDNDKNPVVALREIADETIDLDQLQTSLIQGLQKHIENDEPEETTPDFDALAGELAAGFAEVSQQSAKSEEDESAEDGEGAEESAEPEEGN